MKNASFGCFWDGIWKTNVLYEFRSLEFEEMQYIYIIYIHINIIYIYVIYIHIYINHISQKLQESNSIKAINMTES